MKSLLNCEAKAELSLSSPSLFCLPHFQFFAIAPFFFKSKGWKKKDKWRYAGDTFCQSIA